MDGSTNQILKDALQLPEAQRATLVVQLLESLKPAGSHISRSDADWQREIERRARAAQAGEAGLSWEDTRRHILDGLPKV